VARVTGIVGREFPGTAVQMAIRGQCERKEMNNEWLDQKLRCAFRELRIVEDKLKILRDAEADQCPKSVPKQALENLSAALCELNLIADKLEADKVSN
jgi:hypothetical protein